MKSSRKDLIKSISKFSDEPPMPLEDSISLASSSITPRQGKKKKKSEDDDRYSDPTSWFATVLGESKGKVKSGGRGSRADLFGERKKKKRKKKGEFELTDFNREFDTEVALLNNLLRDNSAFVQQMQKEYDHITSSKSTSRGISKTTTDLAATITASRTASLNIIKEKINIKKLAQDMHMKEIKEFGLGKKDIDDSDIVNNAALTLKGLIEDRNNLLGGTQSDFEVFDADNDDNNGLIDSVLTNSTDGMDSSLASYLKYEKDNVDVIVTVSRDDPEDFDYVAITSSGEILDDYPLPDKGVPITFNPAVMAANDIYGRKYRMEYK